MKTRLYSWLAQKVKSIWNDFVITNLEMIVLNAHSKNLKNGSFWSFYPKNILQSFSPCKKIEYLESIILCFQISFNVYLD